MDDTILEIVEEVKEDCGDPDITELPDSFIIRAIREGIIYLDKSIIKRKKAYASLTITSGQDLYTIPEVIVTDVYFIDKAYYNLNPDSFATYFSNTNLDLSTLYDSPALSYIFFQKLSSLEMLFPTDFEFLNQQLRIIPTPTENCTILYEYTSGMSLSDVKESDLVILKKYVCGKSMVRIGRKRNSKVRAIPMVGGEIRFDDGSRMTKDGNALLNEFRKEAGLDLSVFLTG